VFLVRARSLARRLDPATAAPASASANTLLVALLLGATLLPLPVRAQERPAHVVFTEALSAYNAGAFRESARRFSSYVRAHPQDPNGWYNLGNAWYRSGEHGRAIWSWLRALRVQPRNARARYNLRLAGIDDALLMRVLPPLRMTEEEILLASSAAWFLAAGAYAVYVLRRKRGAAFIAIVSALLAIVLLLAVGLERVRASTGIAFGATSLLGGPAFRAERLRMIQDGEPLTLVQRQGDWFRVMTPDGAEGWVERSHIGSL
jgi:tetratricopeptide (TPR) repeat protein